VRYPSPILLGLLLTAACGQGDGSSSATDRRVEDGVESVVNRGPNVPLDWTFVDEVRIPPESDGMAGFADISASDVGADAEGRVYVLDRSGGRVVVFGRSGREVGRVGRPGSGPGELSEPEALGVSTDGELAVYDSGAGGVRRWSPSGERTFERLEAPFQGPDLGVASWGLVYPSLAGEGPDGRRVRLTVEADERTGFLTEVTQPTVRVSFPSCGRDAPPMPPIFSPGLRWSVGADAVVAATGPEYRILVFDRGSLARRIARDVPPISATRELAVREAAAGLRVAAPDGCLVLPEEVVEARGYDSVVPAISDLAVAPDGSIWVLRSVARGESDASVEVLRRDGSYLGTLPPGSPFPVAFAGRAADYRVVSLVTSEEGVTGVRVDRIDRSAAGSAAGGTRGGSP